MIFRLFFRTKKVFQVVDSDPEIVRFRFRKRVVMLTVLVALVMLLVPIFRELKPAFRAHREARALAEVFLTIRSNAAENRYPFSLRRTDSGNWIESKYSNRSNCRGKPTSTNEVAVARPDLAMRVLHLPENDPGGFGKVVRRLCFHPTKGLIVDSTPLANGWLYVVVSPSEDIAANRRDRSRQVVVSSYGEKISVIRL